MLSTIWNFLQQCFDIADDAAVIIGIGAILGYLVIHEWPKHRKKGQ